MDGLIISWNRTGVNNSVSKNGSLDGVVTLGTTLYVVTTSFICLLGTFGNILVLLAFVKEKKLRTVANGLLGHLAFVDMLTCCVVLPWYLAITSGLTSTWACRLWNHTFALLPSLSLHNMCLVSINRYALVTKPVSVYQKWFNKRMVVIVVTLIWVFNTVTFVVVYFLSSDPQPEKMDYCDSSADTGMLKYYILSFSSMVSFVTAFTFYGKLIAFIRKNSMTLSAVKRADSKASMILLALLILFCLSFVVSPILLFLNRLYKDANFRGDILTELALCVLFVNYCINPIFYGLKISLFKQTYKRLLCPCIYIYPMRRVLPVSSVVLTGNSWDIRQANQNEASKEICRSTGMTQTTPEL